MSFLGKIFGKKKQASPRLVVIGLDGTPYTFLQRMVQENRMPNFAQITKNAGMTRMNSVYPTVSSVAWSCYMTGVNPAKHGIYGFVDRKPGSYDITIPSSRMMKTKTLWEMLSDAGKQVIVMNVPVTFPPREVNGILIGGFLSPKLDRAVYPPEKTELIKSLGYRIDTDAWLARESKDKLFGDVEDCLARRRKTLLHLMDNEPWDFFQCHIMETDRLYHFAWEQYDQNDPIYAPRFYEIIKKIDDLLGEVLERVEKTDAELILLSDHGFCTIKYEVYVNQWLAQKGWLALPDPRPERMQLKDVGPNCQVYSLDPGRVFINLQGREPQGSVPQAEYEAWRDKIAQAAMAELVDPETGEPMLEKVLKREDIYDGPEFDRAADLIFVPRYGYDLKGPFGKDALTFKGEDLNGMHTYDDAMLAVRNRPIIETGFSIVDATATVLKLMQVEVPDGLDSRPVL
ncbi:MAG: alkaline phosphatase family protein [Anaerolineae bacterium]|nr:alkaline phosphatase family protein [Anaerolineae bacterium]